MSTKTLDIPACETGLCKPPRIHYTRDNTKEENMSMKPKAALVKAGILPPGSENTRGRMSRENIAHCERLVRDENYDIEGFSVSKAAKAKATPEVPAKVERTTSADPKRLIDVPDQNRLEDEWEAV